MAEGLKGILVGGTANEVYVRVIGRGTFQNSQPLRRFALDKVDQGCRSFVVDLGGCDSMDSTFLGVLAGIGLRLQQILDHGKIQIVNLSARNLELLQTLGLDRLFSVELTAAGVCEAPGAAAPHLMKLPESDLAALAKPLNKMETARLMLAAHEDLIRADQRNAPKFQDVNRLLREQVKSADSAPNESKKNEG